MKLSLPLEPMNDLVDFSICVQQSQRWKVSSHRFWSSRGWKFHSLLFQAALTCRRNNCPWCQNRFLIHLNCRLTEICTYQRGSLSVHICYGLCHLHQRAEFSNQNFESSERQTFWKMAHHSWRSNQCRLSIPLSL